MPGSCGYMACRNMQRTRINCYSLHLCLHVATPTVTQVPVNLWVALPIDSSLYQLVITHKHSYIRICI